MGPGQWAAVAGGLVGGVWAAGTVLPHAIARIAGRGVRRRGRHSSAIALTFDDGPHPEHTMRICDVLEAHDATGTFFVLGRRAQEHPRVLGGLVERGHEIALHGFRHRHPWFTAPWTLASDLSEGLRVLLEIGGVKPLYYRPPWGLCSLAGLIAARKRGLTTVRWSVCPEGFFRPVAADTMAEHIVTRAKAGDIVCLHDAGGFADTPERVTAALELALPRLSDSGLSALSVSEVLRGV